MNLEELAKKRCSDPMNTWPEHEKFHRGNFHPFSGSRYGERYFDELCLRCQLEKAAGNIPEKPAVVAKTDPSKCPTCGKTKVPCDHAKCKRVGYWSYGRMHYCLSHYEDRYGEPAARGTLGGPSRDICLCETDIKSAKEA